MRDFAGKRQQQLRPPTGMTSEILRQVERERIALAKDCAAKFDVATIAVSNLPALADLYTEAGQPDLRRPRSIGRSRRRRCRRPIARSILAQAVRSGLREPKSVQRNARLEAYVDELDRLPETCSIRSSSRTTR